MRDTRRETDLQTPSSHCLDTKYGPLYLQPAPLSPLSSLLSPFKISSTGNNPLNRRSFIALLELTKIKTFTTGQNVFT